MAFTRENAFDMHSVGRETLNSRENGRGEAGVEAYRSCQKHEFISMHDVVFIINTGPFLLGVAFIRNLKSREKRTALFWTIM
jgi:hypothetical protein